MTEQYKTLSKAILIARRKKGMNQRTLADAVKVSQGTISQIELSNSSPFSPTLVSLCAFLEIPTDLLEGARAAHKAKHE
jgi:transcriptional regulator with XRE-family HTH domain